MAERLRRFYTTQYQIDFKWDSEDGYFEIVATDKTTGRYSSVTTVNQIIGDIIHPVLGYIDVEESYLEVENKKLFKKLIVHAIETLEDDNWLNTVLEPALNDDRAEGEWEAGRDD